MREASLGEAWLSRPEGADLRQDRWSDVRLTVTGLWTRGGAGLILSIPAIVMFSTNGTFREPANLLNVLQQASIIGVIAIGQTMVLIMGGFDLSVGAVAGMAGVMTFLLLGSDPSWMMVVAGVFSALALGSTCGIANGLLISKVGINPLITTLGVMSLIRGCVLIVSAGTLVYAEGRAVAVSDFVQGYVFGLPVSGIIFLVVTTVAWLILRFTIFGQSIYAVGGNERAAALSGINVSRVKVSTYTLCSFLASLAGFMLATRTAAAPPNAGTGYELQAITASVIGGCSLKGGRGSVWGTVLGVLMLAVTANGLDLYGVSVFWQTAVTGAVLLIAVAVGVLSDRQQMATRT